MFKGRHDVSFKNKTKSHLNLNGDILKNIVNVDDLIISESF